jgi:hypothetical protein
MTSRRCGATRLDRPLYAQYVSFLKGIGTGNLGTSLRTNQPVTAAIAERLPATFELANVLFALTIIGRVGYARLVRQLPGRWTAGCYRSQTQLEIRNSEFGIRDEFQIPNSKFQIPNSKFQILNGASAGSAVSALIVASAKAS